MKLPQKKTFLTRRLTILIIVLLFSLVALGGVIYWRYYSNPQSSDTRPMNTVDYSPPSKQEKDDAEAKKEEVIKKEEDAKKTNTGSAATTSKDMQVTISRANQAGAGQPLNIRTIITGTNSGECNVELKKDGQTSINKTFAITTETTYATCKQADITASDFSAGGEWNLSITAKNGSVQSPAATTKVTITK